MSLIAELMSSFEEEKSERGIRIIGIISSLPNEFDNNPEIICGAFSTLLPLSVIEDML